MFPEARIEAARHVHHGIEQALVEEFSMRGKRERVPGDVAASEAHLHAAQILPVEPLESQLGKVSRHYPTETIASLTHSPGLLGSRRQ